MQCYINENNWKLVSIITLRYRHVHSPAFAHLTFWSSSTPRNTNFSTKLTKNSIFAPQKKIGRAAAARTTIESLTKASNLKELSSHTLKMLFAPQLAAINADPAELLHVSSTHRDWDLIKFSRQTVLITKSYDRDKLAFFSVKENDRNFRDFRPIIFRLYRRIFGFSLRG